MDLVHLVDLIISWKQREERYHLEKDTAYSPKIHLVTIIAVCEQAFRSTVPAGRDVFCIWLLRVYSSAGSKVCQLDVIFSQKNVLRFDISVENSVSMHMVDTLDELVHVVLNSILRQVVALALDCVVEVHVHKFKN